jgi:phosphomannomutase/phosphoglucomutase
VQGGADGYVIATGPTGVGSASGVVEVPASIWQVRFAGDSSSIAAGDLTIALAIVGGGAVLLLLTALWQWRSLGSDLKNDMGVIVTLGEAILQRESAPQQQPHVSSTADAIALLAQYARDGRAVAGISGAAATMATAPLAPTPAAAPAERATHGLDVEEIDSDPADLLGGGAAQAATPMDVPASLFRAYDIRGVVGDTLTASLAERLGQALATLVQEQGGRQIAVGRDARVSSPSLAEALISGLTSSGCDVVDIGQAPTPLLYFATHTQPVQAGVMVTGSHNPTEYNGFKIVVGDRVLDGADLARLRERMQQGVFNHGSGQVQRVDLLGDYTEAVNREVQLARPLKLVVDAGNGVAGEMAIGVLESLGCEVVPLFCEPDGDFPNHHPDPSQPENLSALILEVQAQEADLGIAFDGDGDRLGVVDNTGQLIWPDRVLMLLASDILGRHPGVDILYDVKSSRHLASFVLSHGGRPIMWQSGHSRMRAKMLETGALLGGEFSGHLFIKERWFGFDDAIYATARVLEILALDSRPAEAIFGELPNSPATPEYQLLLEEGQSAELMRSLDAHKVFDDARLVELDGLRVEFADGWGLIRPSNTVPSLTFRFEADDEGALEQIRARFRDLLRRVAPDLQPPF